MTDYPTFLEHLRSRYGPRWCVAHRMTDNLRAKGHTVALHPTRYAREQQEWAAGHPATLLVETLPEGDAKRLIAKALQRQLGAEA